MLNLQENQYTINNNSNNNHLNNIIQHDNYSLKNNIIIQHIRKIAVKNKSKKHINNYDELYENIINPTNNNNHHMQVLRF